MTEYGEIVRRIEKGIDQQRLDAVLPNSIKMNRMNRNTLNKLRSSDYFSSSFSFGVIPPVGLQEVSIFGLTLKVDCSLKDDEVIVYNDEILFQGRQPNAKRRKK